MAFAPFLHRLLLTPALPVAGITHPFPDALSFDLARADWESSPDVAYRQRDSCSVPAQHKREPNKHEHETTARVQVAKSGSCQRPACPCSEPSCAHCRQANMALTESIT